MTKEKRCLDLQNDTRTKACIARYDACFSTKLQLLRAVSHSLGIHSGTFFLQRRPATSPVVKVRGNAGERRSWAPKNG